MQIPEYQNKVRDAKGATKMIDGKRHHLYYNVVTYRWEWLPEETDTPQQEQETQQEGSK